MELKLPDRSFFLFCARDRSRRDQYRDQKTSEEPRPATATHSNPLPKK